MERKGFGMKKTGLAVLMALFCLPIGAKAVRDDRMQTHQICEFKIGVLQYLAYFLRRTVPLRNRFHPDCQRTDDTAAFLQRRSAIATSSHADAKYPETVPSGNETHAGNPLLALPAIS